MFRCKLLPALLAEWPGSFTCYCGSTGVERIPNWVSTQSWPWRRKLSRRSCRDSNLRPFNHESGALTTELSCTPRPQPPAPRWLGSPYLGKGQQPQEQRYPFLSVCAVFPMVRTMVQLAVLRIINVGTDVNAFDCTPGCTDTVRETALEAVWEKNSLPHRGLEPASVLRLGFSVGRSTNWANPPQLLTVTVAHRDSWSQWQLLTMSVADSRSQRQLLIMAVAHEDTVAHNDSCTKRQLLTMTIAHNDSRSQRQLLTMTIAHKDSCSQWQLHKETVAHNDNCSQW